MGNTREYTGMKLTHGWENDYVIGEIFLNRETIAMLEKGQKYELSAAFHQSETGLTLVGLSLVPVKAVEAAKDEKHCKFCNTKASNEWWKCCPEHFKEGDKEVSCKSCVVRNHPGFFGTGGE